MRDSKYKLEHRRRMKAFRAGISQRPKGFAGYEFEGIRAFLLSLFDTRRDRPDVRGRSRIGHSIPWVGLSLFAVACLLCGCTKPYIDGEKAPSFPVVTPVEDESPGDREQFPPEPVKPAQPTQLPAGYECRDGQCGPARSFQEQPVRRVFSRLPVVRRFGR